MKFSINREQLLKPLQQVAAVVEKRQTLPVLSNVLLEVGDGQLSIAEWQNVLGRMGMKCSTKEAKALFRNVDANGDGNIDLDEFMKYLSS